jgi:putative transposase
VYTQIVEVALGVPFGYEPNEELRKLLVDFREMVNFCIGYAHRGRITSYARLRKGVYEEWKKRWDYSLLSGSPSNLENSPS